MNKIKNAFRVIIAVGVIILFTGLYYLIIKAGIPYQDATFEMQILYAKNMYIGDSLTTIGFITIVLGIVGRITTGIIEKKKEN